MRKSTTTASRWQHDMKNQIGIILGFSELMLGEMPPGDRRRQDVQEIYTAAVRAMDLLAARTGAEAGSHDE